MDGTSDQAASNWGNVYVPGDPNNAPLATSNFDPGHHVTLTGSYDVPFARSIQPVISIVYTGTTGRPYTYTYSTGSDVNGDNRRGNDLLYIPTASDALTYTGGSYQDFFNKLSSCAQGYVGEIIPRNACRGPWTNTLDGRFAVQLPYKKYRTEITLDAFNLINLFNRKNGLVQYVSFNQISQPATVPTTATVAAPITGYNVGTLVSPTFTTFLRDDLRSRWQLQLGAHVRF
jgi:hypothetical protein